MVHRYDLFDVREETDLKNLNVQKANLEKIKETAHTGLSHCSRLLLYQKTEKENLRQI